VTGLERTRAAALALRVLAAELDAAIGAALAEGEDVTAVAAAAGVHRSTLYRRHRAEDQGSQGPAPAGPAGPHNGSRPPSGGRSGALPVLTARRR
jgi:transposase-like protein